MMIETQEPISEGQKPPEEIKTSQQKDEIRDISSMSMITPVKMIRG